jgi:hypothetical protein
MAAEPGPSRSGSAVRWSAVAASTSLRLTELDPVTVRVQRRDTDAEREVLGLRLHELHAAGSEHFELLAKVVRLEEIAPAKMPGSVASTAGPG